VLLVVLPLPCLLIRPPFFNVAKNKPVSVDPSTNICGQSVQETYCQSDIGRQSTLSCGEETCDLSCPHRGYLPENTRIDAFSRVDPSFEYGGCVLLNSTFLSPYQKASDSKVFLGNSEAGPCYMDLEKGWLSPIKLMGGSWTLTLGAWLFHSDQPGRRCDLVVLFISLL
jgi:hypothetical protein